MGWMIHVLFHANQPATRRGHRIDVPKGTNGDIGYAKNGKGGGGEGVKIERTSGKEKRKNDNQQKTTETPG